MTDLVGQNVNDLKQLEDCCRFMVELNTAWLYFWWLKPPNTNTEFGMELIGQKKI